VSGDDAVVTSVSGTILADVDDMRRAAALLGRLGVAYWDGIQEFRGSWVAAVPAAGGLPPEHLRAIEALGVRIEQLSRYLRVAADRYEEADRFAPYGIGDYGSGARSSLRSLSLTLPLGLLGGHWRPPRLDPRLGGLIVGGARAIADAGPPALPEVVAATFDQAVARERATHVAVSPLDAAAARPPRSVADLADRVDGIGARGGNAAVELVTGYDGARRAIVYLRGTTRWDIGSEDPTDLDGNIAALAGASTAYGRGVVDAMRDAGIDPRTPVLLVGHSQGGMVAANLARELTESGEFAITDVLTFGAPFAQLDHPVPPDVQLIAVENRSDVVPALDGRRNSRGAGTVTVTVDDGDRNLGAHDMDGYRAGAAALDAATSAEALAVAARIGEFASGGSSSLREYRIARGGR